MNLINILKSVLYRVFDSNNVPLNLVKAVDKINERWGDFVVSVARMLAARNAVPDRIAFGNVKELEEFTLR